VPVSKKPPSWHKLLHSFIANLRIISREETAKPGEAGTPLKLWQSQQRILDEVAAGMDQGVRKFYVLKSRQLGSTTIWVVIALFWLALHPKMKGALVVDQDKTRDDFREQIRQIVTSIPQKYFGDAFGIRADNRHMMMFSNGSQLNFLVAGTSGSKTAWGESSGYSLVLLTEVANYGSPEGLSNFEEAMSETNPERLYVYESTAKGYNHWRERWLQAKADPFTCKAIFVGWWSKEHNRIRKTDPRFSVFGLTPPDERERERMKVVSERYHHDVTEEQLAWIRWRATTNAQTEASLSQNQPWVEEDSFVQTGKSYFQIRLLSHDYERIMARDDQGRPRVAYQGWRFWFGASFWDTTVENLGGDELRRHEIELRQWFPPMPDGQYVIGCDPAGGSDEKNDRHAIQVGRCYGDRLVQVAEYADNRCETRNAAWVLAYLAGMYRNCMIMLELSGGYGKAVKVELNHLREMLYANPDRRNDKGDLGPDFLANARHYLYRRPDAPTAAGYIEDFMTTADHKREIFNEFRDAHINGALVINSIPLLEEMQTVVQDGDTIGAPGNTKDDRTFAGCLMTHAWAQHYRGPMMMQGELYQIVEARESGRRSDANFINRIVSTYLREVESHVEITPAQAWMMERGLM
jgi:hypothetical protein